MTLLFIFIAGLSMGSFVNALVWRIHEQNKKKNKNRSDLSIAKGRSMCTHCGHLLSAADLIPVFSWLSLGGKCRYCKKQISWQYPLVELLTAILFIGSYVAVQHFELLPYSLQGLGIGIFVLWLVILTGLVALVIYDVKWMQLPNRIVFPLVLIALMQTVLTAINADDTGGYIISALLAVSVSAGPFYLLYAFSGGRLIGGGDVKLCLVLGLIVGSPLNAMLMLFLASLLGCIAVLPGLLTKKVDRKSQIPFGPFLIIGSVVVYVFGNEIISGYERYLLGI